MYTLIRLIVPALFLLVFNLNLSGQTKHDYDSLANYISAAVNKFEVPGFAVGIVKNNEVVFEEAWGYGNMKEKTRVDSATIFAIASCTKAFTAAALAILVDEGKINWDDKVISHYPEFRLYDPYVTAEMQVEDLLCHRSGLETFDGDLLWYGTNYSREEVVDRIQHRENSYSFRAGFGYQNVMYIAAGELIESVSGISWDQFITEHFFQPMNMDRSSTSIKEINFNDNVAWPHIEGDPVDVINYDNVGPAASINTSVDDLLHWVKLMLNKGTYDSLEIFSDKQYYKLVSPHTMLNAGKAETIGQTHFYGYGLGWFVFDYQGRKVIQHGGGLPGFHSKVVFIPEENVGFVILANQISGLVEATYRMILDFYLSDNSKDWASLYYENQLKQKNRKEDYYDKKSEARMDGTQPSLALEAYTGTYEDEMYGKAEITLEDDRLLVTLLPTAKMFTADLHHWHFNTFNFRFNDPFLPEGYLTFILNQDAQPEYFTIELNNPDFHFHKLKFVKLEN